MNEPVRCRWAAEHPELIPYHDDVWGVPTRDDREIFAAYGQCVLHAGLLWTAMLIKRGVFRRAFDEWDAAKVARYDGVDIDRLLHTEGMIRNFQKINAIISNAARILDVQREFGSFATYVWRFADDVTVAQDTTGLAGRGNAAALSDDLKQRGFKFAGPSTAYGLMQDIGMINDHDPVCFRAATSMN